ncbi:MAG: aspartate aminotransferase family protein, partial [Planctomycetota bacterium]
MSRQAVLDAADGYELPAYPRLDIVAARGEGARLLDVDGTAYLDLYGGHAVALLGHSPAAVVDAVGSQARDLLFYSNVVHAPARAAAAARLCRLAPWDDARVFFTNSGTEANEAALRLARQATGRLRVAAFDGGFHGRTLGALAACGLGDYRAAAAPVVRGCNAYVVGGFGDVDRLERLVTAECAAVLVEPVQSMGGVRPLGEAFARALRRRCDETGALLVFDEVQTAPARTGRWFCGEHWGVVPDLITTAKGVAGGFPAGVLLAGGAAAAAVRAGDLGSTFGGGPTACAAIDATLRTLEEMDGPACARRIEGRVREGIAGAAGVEEVRGLGALLGVRVRGDGPALARRLREERRVLVGGCPGDPGVLRLLPPLNITADELRVGIER